MPLEYTPKTRVRLSSADDPGSIGPDAEHPFLKQLTNDTVSDFLVVAARGGDTRVDVDALTAFVAGFATASLLPVHVRGEIEGHETLPDIPGAEESALRDTEEPGAYAKLAAIAREMDRGPSTGDDWVVSRHFERHRAMSMRAVAAVTPRLVELAPVAVLQWLEPSLAEVLNGPEALRLRSQSLFDQLNAANDSAIRKVTQNFTIRRSPEQMLYAAKQARLKLLQRSAADETIDRLTADLCDAYKAWLSRESPPLGVCLLVALRVVAMSCELRGTFLEAGLHTWPVMHVFDDLIVSRVGTREWYACGRAGMRTWEAHTQRYWAEGLASLVPQLDATIHTLRRQGATAQPSGTSATERSNDEFRLGETVKKWQDRLRLQLRAREEELTEHLTRHAATLAQMRADHARAVTAAHLEREALHGKFTQSLHDMEKMGAALRRVERDAQHAMARVVQLEDAIEALGGMAADPVSDAAEAIDASVDTVATSHEGDDGEIIPADCFKGRRVFVFTGQLRQRIQEHMAERFRALGCAEVHVRLIHRDHGPAAFRADDCIVLDLTFASHADTAKVRVKGEAAGAWMFQAKHGPGKLAQEAARAWVAAPRGR